MSRGRARLRNYNQRQLQAITTTNTPITHHRSAEGDTQRLRGIPAIGKGVEGAIPGTRPDTSRITRHTLTSNYTPR